MYVVSYHQVAFLRCAPVYNEMGLFQQDTTSLLKYWNGILWLQKHPAKFRI